MSVTGSYGLLQLLDVVVLSCAQRWAGRLAEAVNASRAASAVRLASRLPLSPNRPTRLGSRFCASYKPIQNS